MRKAALEAMLEAMACARPILASDAGGQADLISHGETGALLPVEDLDRLPEAIEEMLGLGADALARMGRAARAHVETAHTSQAEREAYVARAAAKADAAVERVRRRIDGSVAARQRMGAAAKAAALDAIEADLAQKRDELKELEEARPRVKREAKLAFNAELAVALELAASVESVEIRRMNVVVHKK